MQPFPYQITTGVGEKRERSSRVTTVSWGGERGEGARQELVPLIGRREEPLGG